MSDSAAHLMSLALVCMCLLVGLSGCETIKGAGKDIEKAGEAIQRAAK